MCDMRGFRSVNNSTSKKVPNLLETGYKGACSRQNYSNQVWSEHRRWQWQRQLRNRSKAADTAVRLYCVVTQSYDDAYLLAFGTLHGVLLVETADTDYLALVRDEGAHAD